jgi:hypothetical protein
MPMLRTTKIAVIAVSMINPVRSLEVRALRPAQSNSMCIQPLLALMVAASCFNSGLTGWSILLSHENITLVPSTRFFCALTARGLGFTGKPILRSALSAVSSAASAPRVVLFQRAQDN